MEVKMYKVAIVDDNAEDRDFLKALISRFSKEENCPCQVTEFEDGSDLISYYDNSFQLIFMDIEMKMMDGLQASLKLRKQDVDVPIIFTTNYEKFALDGYDVDALDFMIKPLKYFNIRSKMLKAFSYYQNSMEKYLLIKDHDMHIKIALRDIAYIEKEQNYCVFHMQDSSTTLVRSNMSDMMMKLVTHRFFPIRSGCLINPYAVSKFNASSVFIQQTELKISRTYKKEFADNMMTFFGEVIR